MGTEARPWLSQPQNSSSMAIHSNMGMRQGSMAMNMGHAQLHQMNNGHGHGNNTMHMMGGSMSGRGPSHPKQGTVTSTGAVNNNGMRFMGNGDGNYEQMISDVGASGIVLPMNTMQMGHSMNGDMTAMMNSGLVVSQPGAGLGMMPGMNMNNNLQTSASGAAGNNTPNLMALGSLPSLGMGSALGLGLESKDDLTGMSFDTSSSPNGDWNASNTRDGNLGRSVSMDILNTLTSGMDSSSNLNLASAVNSNTNQGGECQQIGLGLSGTNTSMGTNGIAGAGMVSGMPGGIQFPWQMNSNTGYANAATAATPYTDTSQQVRKDNNNSNVSSNVTTSSGGKRTTRSSGAVSRNSSIDNFLSLVESGVIPQPDGDTLSESFLIKKNQAQMRQGQATRNSKKNGGINATPIQSQQQAQAQMRLQLMQQEQVQQKQAMITQQIQAQQQEANAKTGASSIKSAEVAGAAQSRSRRGADINDSEVEHVSGLGVGATGAVGNLGLPALGNEMNGGMVMRGPNDLPFPDSQMQQLQWQQVQQQQQILQLQYHIQAQQRQNQLQQQQLLEQRNQLKRNAVAMSTTEAEPQSNEVTQDQTVDVNTTSAIANHNGQGDSLSAESGGVYDTNGANSATDDTVPNANHYSRGRRETATAGEEESKHSSTDMTERTATEGEEEAKHSSVDLTESIGPSTHSGVETNHSSSSDFSSGSTGSKSKVGITSQREYDVFKSYNPYDSGGSPISRGSRGKHKRKASNRRDVEDDGAATNSSTSAKVAKLN